MDETIQPTLAIPQEYDQTLVMPQHYDSTFLIESTLLMPLEIAQATLAMPDDNQYDSTLIMPLQTTSATLIMPETTVSIQNNSQLPNMYKNPTENNMPIMTIKTSSSSSAHQISHVSDDILSSLIPDEEEEKKPVRALPWATKGMPTLNPKKQPVAKAKKKSKAEIEDELLGSQNIEEEYESSFIDDKDSDLNLNSDEDLPKKRGRGGAKKKPAKKESAANKCKKTKIISASDLSRAMEELEQPIRKTRITVSKTLPSILISGIGATEKKKLEESIKKLGGKIVNQFSENPTHLVMDKFLRTLKLLEALNRGIDLISTD